MNLDTPEQTLARRLQSETGCSYETATNRVRSRVDDLVAQGFTHREAVAKVFKWDAKIFGLVKL